MKSSNEVGKIAASVDSLSNIWRKIIGTLSECSSSLSDGAAAIHNTASGLVECAADNKRTSTLLSHSITETTEAIQKIDSDISEIEKLIGELSAIANEKMSGTDSSKSLAEYMVENAENTLASITEKTGYTKEQIAVSISSLQEFSKINIMVENILSIASQTNILALNASVESARAGGSSAGFSVVADEIKVLATHSKNMANDIQAVCHKMNENIEKTQECFKEVINFIEGDVSGYFTDMQSLSMQLKNTIDKIHQTTKGVETSVKSIKSQTRNFGFIISSNENGMQSIMDKANITDTMANDLNNLIYKQRQNADRLNEIVDKFEQ